MKTFVNISNSANLIIFRTANHYLRFEILSPRCLIAGEFDESGSWSYIDHVETRSTDPFDLYELIKEQLAK